MNRKHQHHNIAQSKGGSDEEWNISHLSPYDHAYTHALDFVLFPEAPAFDFRHEGWRLLPADLQEAVRKEKSRRQTEVNRLNVENGLHNFQTKGNRQRASDQQFLRVSNGTHPWKTLEHSKTISERFKNAKHWVNEKGEHKFQHKKPEGNWQNARNWKTQ